MGSFDGREQRCEPASRLAEQIEHGDQDLLRSMVKTMAEALMSAEADGLCGADPPTGEVGHESGRQVERPTGRTTWLGSARLVPNRWWAG